MTPAKKLKKLRSTHTHSYTAGSRETAGGLIKVSFLIFRQVRGESSDKTPPLLRFVLELGLSESMGGDGRTSSHSSSWVSRSSLSPSLGVGGVHSCVTSVGRLLSFFIHKLSTADWLVKRPERGKLPLPSSNLPITRRQILGAGITPPALSHTYIHPLLL